MKGYITNIENRAFENTNYREVLYTTKHTQLVLMRLEPGDEIGMEVHPDSDQYFRIKAGHGKIVIDNNEYAINGEMIIAVPAGAHHNLINTSDTDPLLLYTLYAPPQHQPGTIHEMKQDALEHPEHYEG